MAPDRTQDARMRYVEEFGVLMADYGIPRMSGRILGWLLICDPPAQSSTQIAEALRASKGSISTSARLLVGTGLIDRFHVGGSRQTYYRMAEGVWEKAFASKMVIIAKMKEMAEKGLSLVGSTPEDRGRLEEMRHMYEYVEDRYRSMLEDYRDQRATQAEKGDTR